MPNTTPNPVNSQRLLRFSSAITTSCSQQSIAYGKCVVAKSDTLTKDACSKEFSAFTKCVQTSLLKQKK